MKNTKYNHLLSKADRVEPNNTWYMSISLKNSFDLKTVAITEDNIEHYFGTRIDGLLEKIFTNVYNKNKIADWTAEEFATAMEYIAENKNYNLTFVHIDNDTIELEAKRVKAGVGDEKLLNDLLNRKKQLLGGA